jgi:hypothetical protein
MPKIPIYQQQTITPVAQAVQARPDTSIARGLGALGQGVTALGAGLEKRADGQAKSDAAIALNKARLKLAEETKARQGQGAETYESYREDIDKATRTIGNEFMGGLDSRASKLFSAAWDSVSTDASINAITESVQMETENFGVQGDSYLATGVAMIQGLPVITPESVRNEIKISNMESFAYGNAPNDSVAQAYLADAKQRLNIAALDALVERANEDPEQVADLEAFLADTEVRKVLGDKAITQYKRNATSATKKHEAMAENQNASIVNAAVVGAYQGAPVNWADTRAANNLRPDSTQKEVDARRIDEAEAWAERSQEGANASVAELQANANVDAHLEGLEDLSPTEVQAAVEAANYKAKHAADELKEWQTDPQGYMKNRSVLARQAFAGATQTFAEYLSGSATADDLQFALAEVDAVITSNYKTKEGSAALADKLPNELVNSLNGLIESQGNVEDIADVLALTEEAMTLDQHAELMGRVEASPNILWAFSSDDPNLRQRLIQAEKQYKQSLENVAARTGEKEPAVEAAVEQGVLAVLDRIGYTAASLGDNLSINDAVKAGSSLAVHLASATPNQGLDNDVFERAVGEMLGDVDIHENVMVGRKFLTGGKTAEDVYASASYFIRHEVDYSDIRLLGEPTIREDQTEEAYAEYIKAWRKHRVLTSAVRPVTSSGYEYDSVEFSFIDLTGDIAVERRIMAPDGSQLRPLRVPVDTLRPKPALGADGAPHLRPIGTLW